MADDMFFKKKDDFSILIERAKKLDNDLNFTDLRMAFVNSKYYNPYEMGNKDEEIMRSLFYSNDINQAKKYAQKVLEKNILNIDAHLILADENQFNKYMLNGLLKSILSSGSGKTIDSPFVVIEGREEWALINLCGLKFISQSLINENGKYLNIFKVKNIKSGNEFDIYFNIDIQIKWLNNKKK